MARCVFSPNPFLPSTVTYLEKGCRNSYSATLCSYFSAGSHLQRIGETMEPAFFIASRIVSFSSISKISLITQHLNHIGFHTDLFDKTKVTLNPIVMLLFINNEFLNHCLGHIIIIKHCKCLTHLRQCLCRIFTVIFQHFLDIRDNGICFDLYRRCLTKLNQASIALFASAHSSFDSAMILSASLLSPRAFKSCAWIECCCELPNHAFA